MALEARLVSQTAMPQHSHRDPHVTQLRPAFELPDLDAQRVSPVSLEAAADWLERSMPVVVPTETVYGLAARAHDRVAVARVYEIKGRPSDNPLIVHVTSRDQLHGLGASVSPLAERLIRAYWPGPLTLVLDGDARLPWVSAGLRSIAVRCPTHAFVRALIERCGPLAAPSANLSGRPSPTRAAHAQSDLSGRVPLVVDAGTVEHGLESTVLDARGREPMLLRAGSITSEQIRDCVHLEVRGPKEMKRPPSPGMKYRHYSPRAELWLYPAHGFSRRQLEQDARQLRQRGLRVGAVATEAIDAHRYVRLPDSPTEVARHLFSWLRDFDAEGVHCILFQGVSPTGVGRAVMERLDRAASRKRTGE